MDEKLTWVLVLLGAGLTTWLILRSVGHLRDNAGPALNEMGREIEVDTAVRRLEYARETVEGAIRSEPFDPQKAVTALNAARRALGRASELMEQATPEQRARLEAAMEDLQQPLEKLSARLARRQSAGVTSRPDGLRQDRLARDAYVVCDPVPAL